MILISNLLKQIIHPNIDKSFIKENNPHFDKQFIEEFC
jgi:hypothetical protein